MKKIEFKEGQLVQAGFVDVDGKIYNISEAQYTGETPLSPGILNELQENAEEAINEAEKNSNTKIKETKDSLTVSKQVIQISSLIPAGTEYELPCNYKVGNKSLSVHWENVLLEEGEEGNYMEIGEAGATSNKIKFGWDIEPGETLIIEVRGVVDE